MEPWSTTSLADLPLVELRSRRMLARRIAEVTQLRSRQAGAVPAGDLARAEAEASALTDELIARYAADLSLVDSLLEPACPPRVVTAGRGDR